MCCERCNKWQHIRCHDQADFIAGRPRRNWELVDFLCAACTAKSLISPYGFSSQQQQQPQRHHPDAQIWSHYGENKSNNGIVPRTSQPAPPKPTYKQTSYEAVPYSNGRTHNPLPHPPVQQTQSTSAALLTQYANRPKSSAMASSQSAYPASASHQSQAIPPAAAPAPPSTLPRAPYPSGPNMYLSHYSGNSRPSNPAQPAQLSSSAPYRSTVPVAPTGAWSPQQLHYSQLAPHQVWNGATHGSVSQPYMASGPSVGQPPVQQARYYRPHPTATSNPLPSAQNYYTGGPNSQS